MGIAQAIAAGRRNSEKIARLGEGYERMWRHLNALEAREIEREERLARAVDVQEELAAAVREQTRVLARLGERMQLHEVTEARSWVRALLIQVGQISVILAMGAGIMTLVFKDGAAEWVRATLHQITR